MARGSRTVFRVIGDIFKKKNMKGGATTSIVCNAACDTFCDYKNILLSEFLDEMPDIQTSSTREKLTDIKTASDVLLGGACTCKCELPKNIIVKMTEKLG